MTSESCLNYRHGDCGRDDCECVCHDNAGHLVRDADLREVAEALQQVAHIRMTDADLAACEARSLEEDVPPIPAALMRRMVAEIRELLAIEARHTQGHAEQYFEHTKLITRLTAQVELAQLTITNLRGLVSDLEEDYAPTLSRAKELLGRTVRHYTEYHAMPLSFLGEAEVLIDCISRLESRRA